MKKILVIDGDEDSRCILDHVLGQAGFEIELISDGQEALDRVALQPVDMVITEMCLPRCNGLAVLRAIRADERWSHTRLVMFSAVSGIVGEDAMRAGAETVIPKPMVSSALVQMVRQLLDKEPGQAKGG